MHDTAYEHGRLFFEVYWQPAFHEVVDLGSQDVNGSLRDHCPSGAHYVGLDMAPGRGVDVVVEPGAPLPFDNESVDIVVTSSAFEHDVAYWQTFVEMARVIRPGGLLYVNAPSNNDFHRYPLDCWRFYPDAGVALEQWATTRGVPVELVESFVAEPGPDGWADFVAVFRRPSTEPAPTTSRIADRTACVNVHSGSAEVVEAEQPQTFEVRELARLREALTKAEAQEGENAALRKRIETLSSEKKRAEAALARLRSSASWRATAPVRKASERIRNLRRAA